MYRQIRIVALLMSVVIWAGAFRCNVSAAGNKAESLIFYDGAYYPLYVENDSIALYANTADGNILILYKKSGKIWSSAVSKEDVEYERSNGLGGQWLNNIRSPFIVEYVDRSEGVNSINYVNGNFKELNTVCTIKPISNGIKINYYLTKIKCSISYEITIGDSYVDVKIPYREIIDMVKYTEITNDNKERMRRFAIANIKMLPFLGYNRNDAKDSYYMVPDGPGGLIKVKEKVSYLTGYSARIYGRDDSALSAAVGAVDKCFFPVFGVKSGDNAFTGIIKESEYYASIVCTPPGVYTRVLYWACPQFINRHVYWKITGANAGGYDNNLGVYVRENAQLVMSDDRIESDKAVRYVFSSGEDSSYAGMAKAYRKYLMNEKGVSRMPDKGDIPLKLYMFGGTTKKNIIGSTFIKTTSFQDAGEILERIYFNGIKNCSISFEGWMKNGGSNDGIFRFPAEKKLGGDEGLKMLVKKAHQFGYEIMLSDSYSVVFNPSIFFRPRKDSVFDIMNRVLNYRSPGIIAEFSVYIMSSVYAKEALRKNIDKYKEYGVDGLTIGSIGSHLATDFDKRKFRYRHEVAEDYREMLEMLSENFKNAAAYVGSAYLLGSVDAIEYSNLYYSYSQFIDEVVPFYEIVRHGFADMYSDPVNYFDESRKEYLRCIEYGIIPAYLVTMEDSSVLAETDYNSIYSSQFSQWEEDIYESYRRASAALSKVRNKFINNHEKLADNVYRVTYENDIEIVVNYRESPFSYKGVEIEPLDFKVFE